MIATTSIRNRNETAQTLRTVTVAGIVGLAGSLVYAQAVIEQTFEPVPSVNAAVLVGLAGLLASGWRRGPIVATGWLAFMLLGSLQVIVPRFAHTDQTHLFVWNIITVVMAVIALGGAVAMVMREREKTVVLAH